MRVDIGIILSVLSFSVLAKVIPNDDSHGPLLVRRAVGPDTTDLLWKRNNGDDKQGPSPTDLDIGAEAGAGAGASSSDSSSNHPSGSGELSKLYQLLDSTDEPRWPFQKYVLTQRPKYILQSDEESIQKAVEKVTEVFEGENKEEFISEVETVLAFVLNSIRVFLAAYDSRATAPFLLFIPKGANRKSFIKKIIDMQKDGRRYVEEALDVVEIAISGTVKDPRNAIYGLRRIGCHTAYMRNFILHMYHSRYVTLFSRVKSPKNKARVKVTESYIRQVWSDWDVVSKLLDKIERMVNNGMIKPKPVPSIFSSLMSNIKWLLGINDEPPTDTTTDQETVTVRK
ncbi:hypothetical protein BASA50_007795 [Batrachochytrium salamandrivorans]|uniref:Uncharacterized protein n=1 Tax=Batrachochytrium salamandrivorans TaxID=1357716 RepID=A0ABQ8F6K7_9FUNG|nr:hypothetical protein BASA50_007802 [Batrachochytrium salamandrivorans]KAH6592853.1 hypothetical protein BASA50_007795 [Batrachochytrium salamandrivorans]